MAHCLSKVEIPSGGYAVRRKDRSVYRNAENSGFEGCKMAIFI